MILIIFGSFMGLLGLAIIVCSIIMICEGAAENKRPQPWTLMCNDGGKHSYIGFNGELATEDFSTREEAEAAVVKSRQWHADYEAGKLADSIAKREAEKLARAQSFKPCIP